MKKLAIFSCMLVSALFYSCEEEKNARIQVWLTDDPGDFQEVNVDLLGVEIHSSETDNERGWTSLEVMPRVINLLELANGEETLLGELDLPGGKLSQIRLKLGENNSVKVDDAVYPLSTPSAQQSGLKIMINKVLAEGITYKILLDFDAAKSVVHTGSNDYILKPVIRAITEAQDGAIKGIIEPAGIVHITVMAGEEEVTTTATNEDGEFLIQGLAAGTYQLIFDAPGDAPNVEEEVSVTLGETTDVGIVAIAE